MAPCSLDMFTRDCSVNQSDTQRADGSPHNLAGIQPSNWASFIPSNGPFVLMLCWAKAKAKMAPLLHKPTCLKMHIFTYWASDGSGPKKTGPGRAYDHGLRAGPGRA